MIKDLVKTLARRLGIELHRYSPHNSQHCATHAMLRSMAIDLVFDVGANQGQFSKELFNGGFRGRVVSFEPLSEAHAALRKSARRNPRWIVHSRAAVGSRAGQTIINVAKNSVSSSILPLLPAHQAVAPDSTYVSSEEVPLIRLDDVAEGYTTGRSSILLKVDTQGFEWEVLCGARQLLKRSVAVQLELSAIPLYDGQHLWLELVNWLGTEGFQLHFLYPAFTDVSNGRTLQWDALFVRQSN